MTRQSFGRGCSTWNIRAPGARLCGWRSVSGDGAGDGFGFPPGAWVRHGGRARCAAGRECSTWNTPDGEAGETVDDKAKIKGEKIENGIARRDAEGELADLPLCARNFGWGVWNRGTVQTCGYRFFRRGRSSTTGRDAAVGRGCSMWNIRAPGARLRGWRSIPGDGAGDGFGFPPGAGGRHGGRARCAVGRECSTWNTPDGGAGETIRQK